MEEWLAAISNVGFPIVVTLFCLLKLDKSINAHTNVINELTAWLKGKNGRKA